MINIKHIWIILGLGIKSKRDCRVSSKIRRRNYYMAGYICKIIIENTHPPVWEKGDRSK